MNFTVTCQKDKAIALYPFVDLRSTIMSICVTLLNDYSYSFITQCFHMYFDICTFYMWVIKPFPFPCSSPRHGFLRCLSGVLNITVLGESSGHCKCDGW